MDHPDQPVGISTPKLLCIPARPLVFVFATWALAQGVIAYFFVHDWSSRLPPSILIFLNTLLLFGTIRNNELALKWSQRIMFAIVILAILELLAFPVLVSSSIASGLNINDTVTFKTNDEDYDYKKKKFFEGVWKGYVAELLTAFQVGVELVKYTLVRRLWIYAKTTEHVAGNVYIIP